MEDVFGDVDVESSKPLDFEDFRGAQVCENPEGVPGLCLIKGFLNEAGCEYLMASVLAEGWVSGNGNNQAMVFGDLPPWAGVVRHCLEGLDIGVPTPRRVPLFNQMIVNRYDGSEGIIPHVDLLRFKDFIFGVTLTGTAAFEFTPATADTPHQAYTTMTTPGDAYILTNQARYEFKHGIPTREADTHPLTGASVPRTVRISLTMRGLVDESTVN